MHPKATEEGEPVYTCLLVRAEGCLDDDRKIILGRACAAQAEELVDKRPLRCLASSHRHRHAGWVWRARLERKQWDEDSKRGGAFCTDELIRRGEACGERCDEQRGKWQHAVLQRGHQRAKAEGTAELRCRGRRRVEAG